jgi:hypothetical protein
VKGPVVKDDDEREASRNRIIAKLRIINDLPEAEREACIVFFQCQRASTNELPEHDQVQKALADFETAVVNHGAPATNLLEFFTQERIPEFIDACERISAVEYLRETVWSILLELANYATQTEDLNGFPSRGHAGLQLDYFLCPLIQVSGLGEACS